LQEISKAVHYPWEAGSYVTTSQAWDKLNLPCKRRKVQPEWLGVSRLPQQVYLLHCARLVRASFQPLAQVPTSSTHNLQATFNIYKFVEVFWLRRTLTLMEISSPNYLPYAHNRRNILAMPKLDHQVSPPFSRKFRTMFVDHSAAQQYVRQKVFEDWNCTNSSQRNENQS
jgi:hypothetical protein